MNDEQTPALREAVENMRNMRESYDQLVSQNAQLAANVQAIKDAHILEFNTSGVVWTHPGAISPLSLLINRSTITHLIDDSIEEMNNAPSLQLNNLEYLELRKLTRYYSSTGASFLDGNNIHAEELHLPNVLILESSSFQGNNYIKEIYLDEFYHDTSSYLLFKNYTVLHKLYMPKMMHLRPNDGALSGCPVLIDIICGAGFTGNNNSLMYWSPTKALEEDSVSLLTDDDIAAGFTNNLEKLLYNIREHIAANLPTITARYSITFSAAVKAAILADQETADAFTNKGWTIA